MRVKAKRVLTAAVIGAMSVNIFFAMPVTAAQESPMAAVGSVIDYGLLVNKTHKLPDDYESKVDLVSVKNSFGEDFRVERETYAHFLDLRKDLWDSGIQIELESAYRSVARQRELTEELRQSEGEDYVKNFVAVPGFSEHHTGLALDITIVENGKKINDEYLQWETPYQKMHRKLAEHGFILRYPPGKADITGYAYESWHCRYVGQELAKKIFALGVTLEEYLLDDAETAALKAARITPEYWTARNPAGEKIRSQKEIEDFQRILRQKDMMLSDLAHYPQAVARKEILAKMDYAMEDFTAEDPEGLYENSQHQMKAGQAWRNKPLSKQRYDEVRQNCAKESVPDRVTPQYALALRRANLRYLPENDGWYDDPRDAHYDLIQGNVLDPAEPVAVLAESRDKKFVFVDTRNYSGWVERSALVFVDRGKWLAYAGPKDFLVITANKKTIDAGNGCRLEFQMGSRLPLIKPARRKDGTWLVVVPLKVNGVLQEAEVSVPDDETVHKGYLPFSENNLIRQAFRFYMDLYGWGGLEGGVDCSLLTADVYRSLGLDIPGDANRQRDFVPARVSFAEGMSRKERLQAVGQLRPGDMLFSPGHAMMYLGTDDRGEPYIIQAGSSRYFPGEGDEGALKYYTRRVTVDDFYFYKRPDKQLIDAIVSASGFSEFAVR